MSDGEAYCYCYCCEESDTCTPHFVDRFRLTDLPDAKQPGTCGPDQCMTTFPYKCRGSVVDARPYPLSPADAGGDPHRTAYIIGGSVAAVVLVLGAVGVFLYRRRQMIMREVLVLENKAPGGFQRLPDAHALEEPPKDKSPPFCTS
ncbi:hypothetical protein RI367_003546 [Sorochytrium milnesiophthora]